MLQEWLEWTAGAPEEVTSVGRLLQFPPFEEIPEPLRGQSFAVIEAVFLGSEGEGAKLMAPLRALEPVMDTFAMVLPAGIAELHMDPREPMPYATEHSLVGELSPQAITDLVGAVSPGSGSALVSVELRHTGGALSRTAPGHGAAATLPGSFAAFAVGVAADELSAAKTADDLGSFAAALRPHHAGRYLNFTEHPTAGESFFEPATAARLGEVKDAYDPGRVFQANHEIGAGA